MRREFSAGDIVRSSVVDSRRRLTLPTLLADAAGITGGTVVVVRGDHPGELVLASPAAALARLRAGLATALAAHGTYPSLTAALHRQPAGRPPVATPVDVAVRLPEDGPIVCDTAPLLSLLDGHPEAEALPPLLSRLVITDAVADELLETMMAAGLPVDGPGQLYSYSGVCDVLVALGMRGQQLESGGWVPLRILEFELTKAGVTAPGERSTLALARHLDAPALIGRPAGDLPDTAQAVDFRDLAVTDAPVTA